MFIYKNFLSLGWKDIIANSVLALGSILVARLFGNVYKQIWRYGGIQCYIRLLVTDTVATIIFISLEYIFDALTPFKRLTFALMVALMSVDLLLALAMRMTYRYCFKCGNEVSLKGKVLRFLLKRFAGITVKKTDDSSKIKIAIVGAGKTGVSLAEELLDNVNSPYLPRLFIDINDEKIGREIHDIPVISKNESISEIIKKYKIQEIVIAISSATAERKKELYDIYKQFGCKIKNYDYPTVQTFGAKPSLREFDIEDLLFRKQIQVVDENTKAYFKNKVILITGGGGSIGSELCRQLAKMNPKQVIILDIYENGVYDVQQELKFKYKNELDLEVEIASITDRQAMQMVFEKYHPQIVINAAAHKHVPLMENNCLEAVKNNVFGTKNVLELCEEFGAERFMMVSTDKAVNPTNVMGATKRMCEMIVQGYSTCGNLKCSCTRFGNVLGSAGSVIPLFKRQISAGGPITLTDKRIIRYFMTIPEASQLVLQSGAMANNGELFVLDMGQPVKILDLAKNMIELSGVQNIEIIETGLRPGEKLYEELLVGGNNLDTTVNELIFIEREEPISFEEMEQKLEVLRNACEQGDNDLVREALHSVVPTFKAPEEVNKNALNSMEMNIVKTV
ncbi:nucleoside-diphosphate sugar epimerase/dehydratase [uncultured Eubacterium sp.]|uniref:polysaccharide biosynthesis protein n=1 Tax=uncultured Eubacterium sp. TaxID=165185 RepID=UPI0026009D8D|nr:nucleoside-diphosphate sugar epimerase/dehydratase [uncultured Eubacterium sp.]